MLAASPTTGPTLFTERLVLRPLREQDSAAVAAGAGDKRVARYLIAVPSPYPIALARSWVRSRIEWWRLGRGVTLAITHRDQVDDLLGTISLRRSLRADDGRGDHRAELGYWLGTSVWGLGYATEAARAIVDFGFRDCGLTRIYAQVLAGNRGSLRVLDKLGMVNEGVRRKHVRKGRHLHDVVLYGLLSDEWSGAAR
ncbi:MAG TPA: GNAT family protein [Kofleriaceae bacterium]|nr:GNAT family protein [Kofleriaceae bacterium]